MEISVMNSRFTCGAQVVQRTIDRLQGLGLLGLRMFVGQEFMLAGWGKLSSGWKPPAWFSSLSFPFPHDLFGSQFNWYIAGAGELLLGGTLLLGLWTRLSSLSLLYVTYVAIYAVHFDLGWAGWSQIDTQQGQGFKVPLMLGLMLWAVFTLGGGPYSVDYWRYRLGRPASTSQPSAR
jgi:putative oxidoreductase